MYLLLTAVFKSSESWLSGVPDHKMSKSGFGYLEYLDVGIDNVDVVCMYPVVYITNAFRPATARCRFRFGIFFGKIHTHHFFGHRPKEMAVNRALVFDI